jgi:hypothetical protein
MPEISVKDKISELGTGFFIKHTFENGTDFEMKIR